MVTCLTDSRTGQNVGDGEERRIAGLNEQGAQGVCRCPGGVSWVFRGVHTFVIKIKKYP